MTDIDKTRDKLNKCQKRLNNSCIQCKEFFNCDTRSEYVKSVYTSMNPNMEDKNNGFKF